MLFRNLTLYRLPAGFTLPPAELEAALEARPVPACGTFEMQTRGFVHCGYEQRPLHSRGPHHLLALGVEQKLLPASIVNQVAKDRARALAEQLGHPVGRRQMRVLKAQVGDELRAKALTRRRSTTAWLDQQAGWLAVDTGSLTRAEELVETLRDTLGSLPVQPLNTRHAPAERMAAWLTGGEAPGRFALGEELELQAADRGGATIRYVNYPLEPAEIRRHLEASRLPRRLGLVWNGRISFVLHHNLQLKRVRFLDVYKDDNAKGENANEQFDIDFALMTGELAQLIAELVPALGGEQAAAEKKAA